MRFPSSWLGNMKVNKHFYSKGVGTKCKVWISKLYPSLVFIFIKFRHSKKKKINKKIALPNRE